MNGRSILIIDDEESIRNSLSEILREEGYSVSVADQGANGVELMRTGKPDLVLLDIWLEPGIDGIETLKQIKRIDPSQLVIMMSGHGTIETAVRSTKYGAYDFIEKPLSLDKLLVVLVNALAARDLARENRALRERVQKQRQIIGNSEPIRHLRELIQKISPTDGSVLITGENGTGKELVAHAIHLNSKRASKAFVEVNCAAIPEELIESELFGHERGAFTGATQQRRGKFDLAHGGTLFLDEVADMSLRTQAKILRIIQEQKFERVGGNDTLSVNVRILAATNKDLREEIAQGRFREDLYYRLNVLPLQVPALRDRIDDIPLLAEHFLQESARSYGRSQRILADEALALIQSYEWPGNVRELKNLCERIVILGSDESSNGLIGPDEVVQVLESHPERQVGSSSGDGAQSLKDARTDFEKGFILKNLKANGWNVSKTAISMGIERSYLHRKMKAYGIEAP